MRPERVGFIVGRAGRDDRRLCRRKSAALLSKYHNETMQASRTWPIGNEREMADWMLSSSFVVAAFTRFCPVQLRWPQLKLTLLYPPLSRARARPPGLARTWKSGATTAQCDRHHHQSERFISISRSSPNFQQMYEGAASEANRCG